LIDDCTVAVMLELIQGEGGVFMQDILLVKELEKILKEKKILLIIDEVQTGVYRSGKFLISQYFGIKPDIITLAKGLASGIPIGVMMTSLKDVFKVTEHGSTFGGNHLSTTVCKKVLSILEEYSNSGELQENIKFFDDYLLFLVKKYPNTFLEKTGFGFMQGLVLKDEKLLNDIINSSLKNGVLVLKSGKNIIRFLPPLNISKKEMKKGFKRFEKTIRVRF
jgi:acetylornithine aminotransferase